MGLKPYILPNNFGTTVYNSYRRPGRCGHNRCTSCGLFFTALGLSRHWSKCKRQGRCIYHDNNACDCTNECFIKGKRVTITEG